MTRILNKVYQNAAGSLAVKIDRHEDIDCDFIAVDLETTGLSPGNAEIIEIAAVKVKDGQIVDTFSTLVHPARPIPRQATQINGITNEMVADSPTIQQALPEALEFIGDKPMVAHNARFDYGFIKYYSEVCGLELKCKGYCDTLQLARKAFPELKNHKLGTVAEHIGVDIENAHRALDDCAAAAEIFIRCNETLESRK